MGGGRERGEGGRGGRVGREEGREGVARGKEGEKEDQPIALLQVHHYERLSPLVVSSKTLRGRYGSVKPGDCVVVFSRNKVFEIGEQVEKATKQTCALVYGDLPPGRE